MNEYYLVKYNGDWADEMDVYGHMIMNKEEYDDYISGLENMDEITFNCGSNQSIHYRSSEQLKRDLKFIKITEEEKNTLEKLGLRSVGNMPDDQIFELSTIGE